MSPLNLFLTSISEHRVFHALILAYIVFFYRVFEEASRPAPLSVPTTGEDLLDPQVTPIKRDSEPVVVPVVKQKRRQMVARQQINEEEMLANVGSANDTEAEVLEQALRAAMYVTEEGGQRGRQLSAVYRGLASVYSTRGKYLQALHAMDLALGAAETSNSPELTGQTHMALGHLELKHHRYYAAETRFDDALRYHSPSMKGPDAVTLRIGHGWAALMQGKYDKAEERFSTALALAEQIGDATMPLDPSDLSSCEIRGDGFDTDRASALIGLGLAQRRHLSGDVPAKAIDQTLLRCASTLLESEMHSSTSELRASGVWNAIGYAQYLLGNREAALRLHTRARELHDAHAGVRDLPGSSHTKLYLGLVHFACGRLEEASLQVQHLLSTGAPDSEIAEWLVRFAKTHTRGVVVASDQDYGVLLYKSASDLLQKGDVRRLVKHLIDFGRFLYGLKPPRGRDALEQFEQAVHLVDTRELDYPAQELANLYNHVASIEHRRGNSERALNFFDMALNMDRRAAQISNEVNYEKLMVGYANAGAMRLQQAGHDLKRWRDVVSDFRTALHMARKTKLTKQDPKMVSFLASYHNVMRLAHREGVFKTCPGPLQELLNGAKCMTVDDEQ